MTAPELIAAMTATNERVGAFSALDHQATAGPGPLHGVAVGVKELFAVRGLPWTAGSLTRRDVVADEDAAAVARLRAAGALIVGMTRSHEFGWGLPTWHDTLGGPRNPWDLDRITGGSSGGSAAAVAAGMVPLALGTDTGCSIRLPAAFCGVVGMKPTHGRISTSGVVPLAPSFDHVGVLAAEVDEAVRALQVLGLTEPHEPRPDLAGLVVGVPDRPQGIPLPEHRQRSVDAAIEACRARGAAVRTVELPPAADVADIYAAVQRGEALPIHRDELRTWPAQADRYGSDVRGHLERAESATQADYPAAVRRLLELREQTAAVLAEVDVLLTPVAACAPAPTASPHEVEVDGRPVPLRDAVLPYTQLQDLCGLPACAVPAGVDRHGLPVGVQVSGRPWADLLVLDLARTLREALRGRLPDRPPVHMAR